MVVPAGIVSLRGRTRLVVTAGINRRFSLPLFRINRCAAMLWVGLVNSVNRVQERIPLVLTLDRIAFRPSLRLRGMVFIAVLIGAMPFGSLLQGQEAVYPSAAVDCESTEGCSWWQRLHYRADGSNRYGRGFTSATRFHQNRLPVNPPISGPSFGYHQTCWRQVPLVRRCVTCETLPHDREIPNLKRGTGASAPTQIPPSPVAPVDEEGGRASYEEKEPEPLIPAPVAPAPKP